MAASSEKLENCEVCAANSAKYTCPKCEVRTCSLSCVNIHKKELDCDGIRDKTKFVPAYAFSDLDLLSDYRLLEEVGRSVDQLQRDKSKKFTRSNNLPVGLYKLKQAALKSNITLELMPHNFSRNKENTTFYNWKTKELFWRIEWIFQQAENTRWITERALDSTRLSELLESIFEPLGLPVKNSDDDEVQRRILHDKLQYYRSAGLSGIKVLLKAEKVRNAGSKFFELDLTLSIKENLFKKTIIEFPTFYVILKDHTDIYDIIDTDDEEAEKVNTNYRKRKQDKLNINKKKDKGPVNYFFDEDLSEEEVEAKDKRNNKKSNQSIQMDIPKYDKLVQMEH